MLKERRVYLLVNKLSVGVILLLCEDELLNRNISTEVSNKYNLSRLTIDFNFMFSNSYQPLFVSIYFLLAHLSGCRFMRLLSFLQNDLIHV